MATITKKDLVERIVDRTSVKRHDAKKVVQEFLDLIISELKKGNRLEFRDFGVFEIKERAARVAQNPKTMQKVEVPAKRAVKFKQERGRLPSITSQDAWERRMAEGVAFLARMKAEAANG